MERVQKDTVKALAHAYVFNTTQLGICNTRLQGLIDFYKAQQELYDDAGNK